MGKVLPKDINYCFQIRGKVGITADISEYLLGISEIGAISKGHGIYQDAYTRIKWRTMRQRTYRPLNPRTVPQQANRTMFADAMSAWQALTPEEKAPYNIRAKKLRMKGHNLYIREYMTA